MQPITQLTFNYSDRFWIITDIIVNVLIIGYILLRYFFAKDRKTILRLGAKIYGAIFRYSPIFWLVTWLPLIIIRDYCYRNSSVDTIEPIMQWFVLSTAWLPITAIVGAAIFSGLVERE